MICWSQGTLLLLLPLISAYPLLERSTTVACGQFDSIPSGSYSLLTNLWGQNDAASGSQCTTLNSVIDDSVKWSTQWTWTGGYGVKSYANMQLDVGINQQLSVITSMPSTWKWSHTNTETAVADVAYDFFTSWTAGGSNTNEIMVWLANFNAGPISYRYDASGKAVSIASDLSIAGHKWNLYLGNNGYNQVYSFLPVDGEIRSFSGDMYGFFTYLIHEGYLFDSQYLVTAQAGTEATSGSAKFKTSTYSLTINT